MFDPKKVKQAFPILTRIVNGKQLVYLDSGATSQKPRIVIETEREYYEQHNANVHRGAHTLGDESTKLLVQARETVANFIGGQSEEIVFVRNTTEAINLVSYGYGLDNFKEGDVILATMMEHHSNLVPWQQIASRTGARLELIKVNEQGMLDQGDFAAKLKLKPKMVAMVQVSNALGTINPIKEMVKAAHKVGALVLVDGAQAVPHMKVNVTDLGCDFYAMSGHKMLGPMGIGVLWGKKKYLSKMSPFMSGGGMISEVYSDHATWADLPDKFEAGTPNVAGAVGLMAAIKYLEALGMEEVREHDRAIVAYAIQKLRVVEGIRLLGPRESTMRSGSVAFEYMGVHAHDVATVLDSEGVAVRSGHHCTMVLHKRMGLAASVRASFNVYTTSDDIDALIVALSKVKKVFGK